jgi:quercetin dioxygenase-like cupin family protein
VSALDVSPQPYFGQASGHQRLAWTGGHEVAVLLDSAITAGQLTVIEVHTRRGDASPVHIHSRDDEAFLLLDGAMTIWVGDQRRQLQPGGIAFLPRQIPHAIRYDIASRALVLCTPAGSQEGVFRSAGWDLSQPVPDGCQRHPGRGVPALSRPPRPRRGHRRVLLRRLRRHSQQGGRRCR